MSKRRNRRDWEVFMAASVAWCTLILAALCIASCVLFAMTYAARIH